MLNGRVRRALTAVRAEPRARAAPAEPWRAAIVIFIAAFCLYGLTTSKQPQGYEAETNAVAEGVVQNGNFLVDPQSPLRDAASGSGGVPGKDGTLIGRAGLPSVLAKVPFYAAGKLVDERSDGESYAARRGALAFADPAAAAAAVAFFFLVVWRLRRSVRWGIVMAAIFAAGSLAWPYSNAGMETVLMMAAVLLLAGVLYAQEGQSWRPWAVAGFAAEWSSSTSRMGSWPSSPCWRCSCNRCAAPTRPPGDGTSLLWRCRSSRGRRPSRPTTCRGPEASSTRGEAIPT